MLMCFPVDVDRRSVESDWISDEVTRAPIREDDDWIRDVCTYDAEHTRGEGPQAQAQQRGALSEGDGGSCEGGGGAAAAAAGQ